MNVGIDLIQIDRFKKIPYLENESFYKKNFSNDEIEYCLKFSEPYKHFAGKFAAKEATKKTLDLKFNMLDIEIKNINSKPEIIIPCNDYGFDVSISHDGNYAIAIVISRKTDSV